jgi:proline dehydrogenase
MQSKETLPVNFENTETAFRDQSNASLKQAYQLFKVMNNRRLVNIGKHLVNFAFAVHFPIEGIIRNTIYKHFVGGVSIEDCSKTITRLARYNVDSILDYAQEGEESEDAFNATCREVIRTIEFAGNHKNVPFSVFKITGVHASTFWPR